MTGEPILYLIGSPKNWLAMPTVAPVMQITKLHQREGLNELEISIGV